MSKNTIGKIIYFVLSVVIIVLILASSANDRSVRLTQDDLDANDTMTDFYTPGLLLHEGKFKISIFYASDADVRLDLFGNANDNYIDTLPASVYGNTFEKEYLLSKDSQGSKLRFEIPEGSMIYVSDITIESEGLLYTDSILYAVITACLLAVLYIILNKGLYRNISREQLYACIIMTLAVILAFSPHFSDRLYDGNDLGGQLIRIEGVKDAILDGQFPVVLFPRTLGEYGELGAMYPYLFLLFPAILRILNVSLLTAYNLTIISVSIAVVLTAYYCLRSMSVSRIASALSASVYLISPTFIHGETDNGAMLGAGIAYIFIPLVLTGASHIMQGRTEHKNMFTIGVTGMLQSHLVTTLLMIPCSLFIITVLAIREAYLKHPLKKSFLCLLQAGAWCIPLNIWWAALFFYYYINGNLFTGALGNTFSGLKIGYFFSLEATRYSLLFLIISMIILVILSRNKQKSIADPYNDSLYIACSMLALLCLLLFACTNVFPWESLRGLTAVRFFTDTMQFPARFYVVISASTAIFTGIILNRLIVLFKNHANLIYVSAAVLVFAAAILFNHSFVSRYLTPDNFFCSQIIGDISSFKQREYLPDGTSDEYYQGRHTATVSDENGIRIDGYQKREDSVTFTYFLDNDTDNAYIELPMFFYPGYEASLTDGTRLFIETGTDNHMRVYLPSEGSGSEVRIRFAVRPLWTVLTLFSICAFAVFIYINFIFGRRTSP